MKNRKKKVAKRIILIVITHLIGIIAPMLATTRYYIPHMVARGRAVDPVDVLVIGTIWMMTCQLIIFDYWSTHKRLG